MIKIGPAGLGGVKETVVDSKTGVFFNEQNRINPNFFPISTVGLITPISAFPCQVFSIQKLPT